MAADLRAFLQALETRDDLGRVEREVDTRHEIAAVLKRGAEEAAPALLFEQVKGDQMPLVGNVLAARRRLALCLGAGEAEMLQRYSEKIENPLPPAGRPRIGTNSERTRLQGTAACQAGDRSCRQYPRGVCRSHPFRDGEVGKSYQGIRNQPGLRCYLDE